jgi:hypothetical protein
LFFVILFLGIAGITNNCQGSEAEQPGDPAPGQRSDEIRSKVKPEWKMPDYYPAEGFDGMGYINDIAIRDDRVVINDSEFRISPSTEYHTPTFENAPGALFKEGDRVGYVLDSEKTITSMWLIVIKR